MFDIHVADATATQDATVVGDDAPFQSLAWTADGKDLIDIETGTQAGIWMYDATASSPVQPVTASIQWVRVPPWEMSDVPR